MFKNDPTLSALHNPNYLRLWSAFLTSVLSGTLHIVAASWLMTSLTNSAHMVALVNAVYATPVVLFSLFSGVIADGFNRRIVIIIAQSFMLSVTLILTSITWFGLLTPEALLLLTFLIGCGIALQNPSWQASMGDIVSRKDVPSAVVLNNIAYNIARSTGPAIGGVVMTLLGAAATFLVSTVGYIVMISALSLWRPNLKTKTITREPFFSAMASGFRYASMASNIPKAIIRAFVYAFAGIATTALLPLIVKQQLDGGVLTFGFMLACFGCGAMAGALASGRFRQRFANESIARIAFLVSAISTVGIAFSDNNLMCGLFLFIAGGSWVNGMTLFNVTIQLSSPRWIVGRTLSLHHIGVYGGLALGSATAGVLAEQYNITTALYVASAILICGGFVGLLIPLPQVSGLDLDPSDKFKEPNLALDLQKRSGPITIMIEYEIDEDNRAEFLTAMAIRRRNRIRDGARKWALLRDLENPNIWSESYYVATWEGYIRHNSRQTNADLDNIKKLSTLNKYGGKLRVSRKIQRQPSQVRSNQIPPTGSEY